MTQESNIRAQLGLGESQFLRLTDDELALVLVAMKLPRIMGFEVPDDVSPAALQGARNTLRARGGAFVQPDGTLVISEQIADMVGKGARWGRLITVVLKFEGGLFERHWVYMGRGPSVLHSLPEPGIHQFQTIPDGKSMLLTLSGLLRMRLRVQTMPDAEAFQIDPAALDEADLLRVENGSDAAYQYLVAQNFPESFAQAAVSPAINAVVSVTWPTTGEPNDAGKIEFTERVMWLWGLPDEGGYWMLFPRREQHIIEVLPANPGKVLNTIGDFVVEDIQTGQ